ncbi:MAG: endodeoxyribonuclease [uncultured marine phage]|uniref:Endodeoxyribonuclease n=1 Tax=uncultured marine phage TaxID=707152 RepID=A0A8D9FRB4_9VIRU|nr:MAG: endodeoxyribonuclease [uncultured marine phage]
MVIYKTTNLKNGKFYIGKDERNHPDYYGSGLLLNRAIEKYGKENFVKEILEECFTRDELNNREIYWIDELNAIKDGYNIAIGGSGGDTYTNNPNLEEISEKFRGENNPFYGKSHSNESIEKMRKSMKGRKAWNKGKTGIYSEEHLENLREKRKKYHGKDHPRFKEIPKEELIEVLKHNSFVKTGEYFGVSGSCIQNKIKYYNISLKHIRNSK